MIRATAGTWLNYATTILMQVLFAARFGTSAGAGAFVICFVSAVSISGVLVTTSSTVVMPKMLDPSGALKRNALRILLGLAVIIGAIALLAALASVELGSAVASITGIEKSLAARMVLLAAALVAIFGIAGLLVTVALALGQRFVPAIAPAFPSSSVVAYLFATPNPSLLGTLAALALGGLAQGIVLLVAISMASPRVADGQPLRVTAAAGQMLSVLVLLALLPPLQRALGGALDPSGIAQLDYATRSTQAAQQLLIGGLLLTVLPDWAHKAQSLRALRRHVASTVSLVGLALFACGAIALVAAPELTAVAFQRGAFSAEDTEAVATVVRAMSPGFVAEGLTLILVQALFATNRSALVARAGLARVAVQGTLSVILGVALGALGVAIAYSASMVVVLIVTGIMALRTVIDPRDVGLVQRAGLAGLAPWAVGGLLMVAGWDGNVVLTLVAVLVAAGSGAALLCRREIVELLHASRTAES